MLPTSNRVAALAIGTLSMISCGDAGYSFGSYGHALDRLDIAVGAFCETAVSCVGRLYANDPEVCRRDWLYASFGEPPTEECVNKWIDFFECYEQQSCDVFPVGVGSSSAIRTECRQQRDELDRCVEGEEP